MTSVQFIYNQGNHIVIKYTCLGCGLVMFNNHNVRSQSLFTDIYIYIYVAVPGIEIEHYSVAYFDHVTVFEVL